MNYNATHKGRRYSTNIATRTRLVQVRKRDVGTRLRHQVGHTDSGCLLWIGAKGDDGYGRLTINRRRWVAHRLSWVLHKGPIPDGLVVRHRCDTPACVAIDHLELGTPAQNRADAIDRGRAMVMIRQSRLRQMEAREVHLQKQIKALRQQLYNLRKRLVLPR